MIKKNNLIILNNLDYINVHKLDVKVFKNNLFSFDLTSDSCSKNFFDEVQQNFFDRELYNMKDLLIGISDSQFKTFFKNLGVDTPEVLNKTKSLKRMKGLTPLSRLSLYLARSGQKLKSTKLILNSFFEIINTLKLENWSSGILTDWRSINMLLTLSVVRNSKLNKLSDLKNFEISDNFLIKRGDLLKTNEFTINNILAQNFKKFNYLFSFYIYKVDKQIYKNSRGKSGKYTFVWKYLAPYKRNFLIMHWLSKEVRISSGKTLQERLDIVLKNFVFNTHSTWIWKIKKFSLNYVYYNLRRTLGETYKTSMK